MKKAIAFMFCLMLVLAMSVPVFAANDKQPETTITEGKPDDEGTIVVIQDTATMPPATVSTNFLLPIEVRMEMVGDVPYITKIYELEQVSDLSILMSGFEQDGYQFSRHDIYQQDMGDTVETQFASQNGSVGISENSIEAVMAAAAPYVDFGDGGFSGQLLLDTDTIHIEESERTSYAYRVTDVREYSNLDRNDASYVPKTVIKNGMALELENIEWVVMGTTQAHGGLVANNFKAIATYAGTATGSEVSGYIATFNYSGLVEKVTPGKALYSVVFRGEPVEQPKPVWPIFVGGAVCLVIIAGIVVMVYEHSKKKRQQVMEGTVREEDNYYEK